MARRSHTGGELHREKTDVRAGVDRDIAGPHPAADEVDCFRFVAAAHDVQPDRVIRQIDEQPHRTVRSVELLDDNRAVVGVGVVGVLLAELPRRHQVVTQLPCVPRAGQQSRPWRDYK